jgi:hypothetical protein
VNRTTQGQGQGQGPRHSGQINCSNADGSVTRAGINVLIGPAYNPQSMSCALDLRTRARRGWVSGKMRSSRMCEPPARRPKRNLRLV